MKRAIFAALTVLVMAGTAAAELDERDINCRTFDLHNTWPNSAKHVGERAYCESEKAGEAPSVSLQKAREAYSVQKAQLDAHPELAVDFYTQSYQDTASVVRNGIKAANKVVDLCTCKDTENKLGCLFYLKKISEQIPTLRPGSKIDCNGQRTSGMLYVDGEEFHIASGQFVRWELKIEDNGLSYVLNPTTLTQRISDRGGNYLTIRYDSGNPSASRFIDAHLPITVQASGAVVVDGQGVAVSSNELMEQLNKFYRNKMKDISTMSSTADALLIDPDFRKFFIDATFKGKH